MTKRTYEEMTSRELQALYASLRQGWMLDPERRAARKAIWQVMWDRGNSNMLRGR